MQLKQLFAAVAVATATLLGMSAAEAKRIGYTQNCWNGDPSSLITQAGHTPVAMNTSYGSLTASALAGLDGLFASDCEVLSNASVDQAVANGLVVWFDDYYGLQYRSALPGNRVLQRSLAGYGVQLPTVAPWTTGPGGAASPAGLNQAPRYTGYTISSLPADVRVLATDQSGAEARLISYAAGRGRVVVSTYATSCMLPGGACMQWIWPETGFPAAVQALTTNLFAWALPPFTSCGAEGYTGPKLTLCRQICEVDAPSATLANRIKLYTTIYRETPPCGL